MLINVTQADINVANPKCIYKCAVALALKRVTDESIMVGSTFCFIGNTQYFFSDKVTMWIIAFGEGRPVKPFTFNLNIKGLEIGTEAPAEYVEPKTWPLPQPVELPQPDLVPA